MKLPELYPKAEIPFCYKLTCETNSRVLTIPIEKLHLMLRLSGYLSKTPGE